MFRIGFVKYHLKANVLPVVDEIHQIRQTAVEKKVVAENTNNNLIAKCQKR